MTKEEFVKGEYIKTSEDGKSKEKFKLKESDEFCEKKERKEEKIGRKEKKEMKKEEMECKKTREEIFDKMDTNNDGKITYEEYSKFKKKK